MSLTNPGNDHDRDPDAASRTTVPYRVLVFEDDRSQSLFAQGVLSGAGMQAQVVAKPDEVLPAVEAFRPDLVLMDLHLPGTSGTELTDLIRAHPTFAHIPIVFLTGDPDPERQFEVLERGADDFLSKPIRPHLMPPCRVGSARAYVQRDRLANTRLLRPGCPRVRPAATLARRGRDASAARVRGDPHVVAYRRYATPASSTEHE